MIISVKIDVKKIEKARLYPGKNGALYLNVTLLERRDGKSDYGDDFMVVQDVSKEERLAGTKGAILGNAKFMGDGKPKPAQNVQRTPPPNRAQPQDASKPPEEDDVPF